MNTVMGRMGGGEITRRVLSAHGRVVKGGYQVLRGIPGKKERYDLHGRAQRGKIGGKKYNLARYKKLKAAPRGGGEKKRSDFEWQEQIFGGKKLKEGGGIRITGQPGGERVGVGQTRRS